MHLVLLFSQCHLDLSFVGLERARLLQSAQFLILLFTILVFVDLVTVHRSQLY